MDLGSVENKPERSPQGCKVNWSSYYPNLPKRERKLASRGEGGP